MNSRQSDTQRYHIPANQTHRINQQPQNFDAQGKGMGAMFGIIFLILAFFTVPFIIADLIYAYQQTPCVQTIVDGISFPLRTWLEVDAYTKLAFISLFFFIAVASCIKFQLGVLLLFSWTIVGAVLFWGKLNPMGVCSGGVHNYMYALLILSFVLVCLNCCAGMGSNRGGGLGGI